jgi:hypothetical protein
LYRERHQCMFDEFDAQASLRSLIIP